MHFLWKRPSVCEASGMDHHHGYMDCHHGHLGCHHENMNCHHGNMDTWTVIIFPWWRFIGGSFPSFEYKKNRHRKTSSNPCFHRNKYWENKSSSSLVLFWKSNELTMHGIQSKSCFPFLVFRLLEEKWDTALFSFIVYQSQHTQTQIKMNESFILGSSC